MASIVAMVYFDRGSQGFEQEYDESVSIEDYVKRFQSEALRLNDANNAVVLYVEKTVHNPDGSFKRDEKGERIMEKLYFNKELFERLFGHSS